MRYNYALGCGGAVYSHLFVGVAFIVLVVWAFVHEIGHHNSMTTKHP